ncbi:MAG: potassium-transporting ATPase subunit KdpC [Rhodospirillales bacterium]|nr:potassium-transporting ATPase subunit KdpC [Rhodospirillales bacterium]
MMRALRPALSLVALFTVTLGLALPALFAGFAQLAFPFAADGSLIRARGRVVGSALIGQSFAGPGWFAPRPSALTGTAANGQSIATPYDASESGASNLAPTSRALADHTASRVAAYRAAYGAGPVPDDAATSSGSGLDPDISLANALRQAPSVAAARHLPAARVIALVRRLAERPWLGLIGTPHVNVLRLNIALDAIGAR